jgi:Tol biopolymer transport system component
MAITDYSVGQNVAYYDFTTNKKVLITHYNWYDQWTYFPIWSPDSKEIVYIKAGWADIDPYSLCITDLDGNEKILYANPAPGYKIYPYEWLPDGKGIVVVQQDTTGYTLGIASINGGNIEILKKLDNISAASVSPDSRYIVFTDGPVGSRDIYIIDRTSKEITTLTDNPSNDGSPKWSPDGEYIAFKSDLHGDYAIWGVKVKDGQPQGPPFMIMPGARDIRLLNWTPVGLALNMIIQTYDIYKMPMDPVTGKSVGNPSLIRYAPTGSNVGPAWAPDGKHFAFLKWNRENRTYEVVILSGDCSEKHEFKLPPKWLAGTIRWTPDGEAIGFTGNDGTDNYDLMRLIIKTGKWDSWPLGLGYWAMMEWGKDGKTYYFSDNGLQGSSEKIVKCSIVSSERQNIYPDVMNGKGAFRSLRCSRDYKSMAFQYYGSISVMDLETGQIKLVTPAADTSGQPFPLISWLNPAWSPDGTKMLVTKRFENEMKKQTFELYILDLGTGEMQKIDLGNTLPRDAQITDTDWSPDGKKILLSCFSLVSEDNLMKTVIPKE